MIYKTPHCVGIIILLLLTQCLYLPQDSSRAQDRSASIQTRDPLKWPFAQNSIWNMPIGDGAVYTFANVQPSTRRGMTVDEDILILEPDAPLTSIYKNNVGWNSREEGARCEPQGPSFGAFPIPVDFLRGQPQGTTENNAVAILMPDGRTLKQNQPFTRCAINGPATTLVEYPAVDLYGDGTEGAHGGSGLSSIGGTIRLGELVPNGMIRHALKINLYSAKNYYYAEDEPDGKAGYRWPAVKSDSVAATTYQGTNPSLQMGTLLALHRDVDLANNELGLETEPAAIFAKALQDYGGYIVDDTAWDVYAVATEYSPDGTVLAEFEDVWGFPMDIADKDSSWGRDMDRIFTNLYVVENNGPTAIGGGGKARTELAPPLVDPNDPAPTATPLPTATPIAITTPTQERTIVTYIADDTNFPNPERGFHDNFSLVDETSLSWIAERGYTLARTYVRLDDYRDGAIPIEVLEQMERGLDAAREAGIKVILRFSYNFPSADYLSAEDASLAQVLAHIEQLAPIFQRHTDVIAVHQAGFIGAWGEWHTSSNNLTTLENKNEILDALLEAVPTERMVQLRYPFDLIDIYPQALTQSMAYRGTDQARTAHHNDCFLAGEDDTGTYWPIERKEEAETYLDSMTPHVVVGGETCQANLDTHRTDCPTALAEMERFHWSYLNEFFYQPAIQRWKDEGCYDEIAKRLGYRYRLIAGSFPQEATVGESMQIILTVTNDGWAGIYNPRAASLVLREERTQEEIVIALDGEDPREWLPQPGETVSLDVNTTLPTTLNAGSYALFLNLPDPIVEIASDSAYSIRLANQNAWEDDSGYNALGVNVTVRSGNVGQPNPIVTPLPPELQGVYLPLAY